MPVCDKDGVFVNVRSKMLYYDFTTNSSLKEVTFSGHLGAQPTTDCSYLGSDFETGANTGVDVTC